MPAAYPERLHPRRTAPLVPSLTLVLVGIAAAPPASAGPPEPPPSAAPADPAEAAAAPAKRVRKPLVAVVLQTTRRVPGYEKVKVYEAPELDAESAPEPTDVKAVEVTDPIEILVLARPFYPSPLLGAVAGGARVPVKGVYHPKSTRGCPTRTWYALEPFGYVCSKGTRPTSQPATTTSVLQVKEGERLPFRYVMVLVKEGDSIPMWASMEDFRDGKEPERKLEHGDSVAVEKTVKIDGVAYHVSVEGKVLPAKGTSEVGSGSAWHGETLDEKTVFPFGWTLPDKVKVFADPSLKGKPVELLDPRTRVQILEEQGTGKARVLKVALSAPSAAAAPAGEGAAAAPADTTRWVRAVDVDEVRKIARPEGISSATQWIDADLGEQVLVAYEGDKPVFATLTSSGRAIPTPRGNYPVWSKVSSISMKSQPYEDKAYFVNKVPWVMFFQAHNAIHGAYWHDRFGVSKSHGCINVSPLDARHLFEWLTPVLPAGWTGYRTPNLLESPTVHVRNSHEKVELVQERPIGPPDKELEAQKLEDAEARRAATPPSAGPTGMAP